MRKHWFIAAGLAVAVIATLFLSWTVLHRRLASPEYSDEYHLFKDSRHIAAAYVRDFRVNDSLLVDVTTLVALDSVGWDSLQRHFHLEDIWERYSVELGEGKDIILSMRYSPDTNAVPDTGQRHFFLAASKLKQMVSIFHTQTREQERAILEYNFNKTYKSIEEVELTKTLSK